MSDAIGWIVRVITKDGVMVIYKAGFISPDEAAEAVRQARQMDGEKYKAIYPITLHHGPKIQADEIEELGSHAP